MSIKSLISMRQRTANNNLLKPSIESRSESLRPMRVKTSVGTNAIKLVLRRLELSKLVLETAVSCASENSRNVKATRKA